MKKKLTMMLTMLLVSTLTFFACANTSGLRDNPIITEAIVSNGGMSVQKGDYLYYVNGTHSSSELKSGDNDWGDWAQGGIYRVKLTGNNEINYTSEGFLEKTELVIPKLVGYENGAFYILGDYIYYSTPNNQKDKAGNSLTKLTDFYRANINGTGETRIYTSFSDAITANDWTMKMVGSDHYLVLKDNQDIISVKSNGNVGGVNKIATGVSSFAFTKETNIVNNNFEATDKITNYVYYSRAITSDDNRTGVTGNIFARSSFVSANEEVLSVENGYTFALVAVKNNSVYYYKTNTTTEVVQPLFARSFNMESANKELKTEVRLTDTKYDSLFILDYNSPVATHHVVAKINSTVFLITNNATPKAIITSDVTILKIVGSTILHTAENGFATTDALNTASTKTITSDKTTSYTSESQVDFDGRFIFVPVTYTAEDKSTHNYLNRIDLSDAEIEFKFIGSIEESHLPEKPDNSELPEDEWVLWIK